MEGDSSEKLKMAIAIALFKSKRLQSLKSQSYFVANANDKSVGAVYSSDPPSSAPPNISQSEDALKWRRKAKERKREILRLREDLKVAEDGLTYDVFPQNTSCKCYFYDNMTTLSTGQRQNSSDCRFNDVLRRRFFRQVRIQERRKRRNGSTTEEHTSGTKTSSDNLMEQLSASVDFLVELSETVSPINIDDTKFKNWSHQAVDFILTALKALVPMGNEPIEVILNSLIMRLLRRMCHASTGNESEDPDTPMQFYIQHLMRKLGSEPYVGQRVIFSVSQKISVAAESLLFMDPFDDAFPNMHSCMYVIVSALVACHHVWKSRILTPSLRIQLIELLVSDCLSDWLTREDFDAELLEQWVASILDTRKALETLEHRNGLYVLYIDRVIGDVAKRVGQSSFLQKLNPNVRSSLFS